ncbi:transient receptor potential cation channel subfamily A member 1-like [Halichondria panicea]|uniref:transient receptor potential cation channel subfamily A member 1-like n=1 Tax=Halichondria panicea TaxID=6063 RepID=UPI00312B3FCE
MAQAFKKVSRAIVVVSPSQQDIPQEPARESNHGHITIIDKRRRRKQSKNREISIEMFSNTISDGMPSPHQLAADGHLDDLKKYIEGLGTTIKDKDENGATLLHHATTNNHMAVMQYLIDSGIDLNAVDKDGNTALHIACDKGHIDAAQSLLGAGASDTILNKASDAPLHLIMRKNNAELLTAYLEYPVDIVIKGYRNRTPLHIASEKDNLDVCRALNDVILANEHFKKIYGFRLCAADDDDLTPLHLAARVGSHRVLRYLISRCMEHGYSPEKVLSFLDEENSTPLHAAVDGGHLYVVEVLLEYKACPKEYNGKQLPPFLLACTQGKLDMMKLMVQHCGKELVHCRDQYGQTALHRCVHCINSPEIIRFLLENGAEIDPVDDEGRTPLLAAIKAGSSCGVKILLVAGASIFMKDKHGLNPLHYTVKHKRKFILRALLEIPRASELVTDCDKKGSSPLHIALNLCQNNLVAMMVTFAAQQLKNIKDVNGSNYLHLAAESGDWKALSILLDMSECQKLLNQTNKYGGTPLHLAAGGGHMRAVEILLSSGAMVHKCFSGSTPFMYACYKGHAEVARVTYEAHPFQLTWTDDLGNNALHLGAQSGCPHVITLLLNIGVPVTLNDCGETFFDVILDSHFTKCAMAAIHHERWQECLDAVGPQKEHPMISLVQSMPEVAKLVLDQSHTKADVPREVRGYWESYNFKYIRLKSDRSSECPDDLDDDEKAKLLRSENYDHMEAPSIQYKGSKRQARFSPSYRQTLSNGHLQVLQTMVRFNRVPLLTHPVTESYLKSKWRKYGRWVQILKMLAIVLHIAFLIAFTFLAPSPVEMRGSTQSSDNGMSNSTGLNSTAVEFSPAANVARFITIGFTTIDFIHWLVTVFRLGLAESLNISRNTFVIVDILSVIFTYIFVIPWTSLNEVIWEAGALASFFTWFSLVLTIQLFDLFGVYVTMFLAITRTAFQVLLVCFLFIIAFAMSLYILAGNTQEFSTLGYSLFTNFAHLLGEIDYISFIDKDVSGQLFFSTLTFMFVIIIAIIMAIVVQNLLIGLAVGDIDLIKRNAIAETRAIEIGFYKRIDTIFPAKLFWRLDVGRHTTFPNKKVNILRFLWKFVWKSIKGEDPNKEEAINKDLDSLSNSDHSIENQVNSINQRIDELALAQGKVLEMLAQILSSQQNSKVESNDHEDKSNSSR